jgi:hypothetical protein
MSNKFATLSKPKALFSALLIGTIYAGSTLSSDNITVETKSQYSSIANDGQLSNNLSTQASTTDEITEENESISNYQEKAAKVIATYQLTDPREQHTLSVTLAQ